MERGSKIVLNTNSPKQICEDSMPMTAGYNMYLQCIEQYGQINEINVKLTLVPTVTPKNDPKELTIVVKLIDNRDCQENPNILVSVCT
jgi:hypothetical protein